MKKHLALLAAFTVSLAAATCSAAQPAAKPAKAVKQVAPAPFKMLLEARALDLLKATSARLAAARSMSFTATVSYEYPSKLGPAIVYTSRYDVAMQRPEQLRVLTLGDGPASEFYLDGKSMLAYAPAENLVAIADAPPTVEAALKAAYEKAAIYFPFSDLLVADPYAALSQGAKLAFYIGSSGVVGGVKTDMLAWANDDVFIQIWIGSDDKLPRRMRAVYSADPLRLRHDMELSNWQLDPQLASDTFGAQKAQGAQRIAFAHPVSAPPPGVKPLSAGKAKPGKSATGAK